jgi:hypothetical protein
VDYKVLDSCVACDSHNLKLVLELGHHQLANDYLDDADQIETFPLGLNLCRNCFHAQLTVVVNPERMFKNYLYVSGTSTTLLKYFETLRDKIIKEHGGSGKLLDIGSNDGTFLSTFSNSEWLTMGVDPAINLIPQSTKLGVITIPTFFTEQLSDLLAKDFNVIVAMNVFAHTANPLDVLLGIKKLLHPTGFAYIQTSQSTTFIHKLVCKIKYIYTCIDNKVCI